MFGARKVAKRRDAGMARASVRGTQAVRVEGVDGPAVGSGRGSVGRAVTPSATSAESGEARAAAGSRAAAAGVSGPEVGQARHGKALGQASYKAKGTRWTPSSANRAPASARPSD